MRFVMKIKVLTILLLLLVCVSCDNSSHKKRSDKSSEVKEYSILQLNLWKECTAVTDGSAYLIDQIAYLGPDIATFCELYKADGDDPVLPKLLDGLEARGLNYYSERIDGRAVISKYPIIESERINDWMFKAIINLDGKRVAVYPAHSEYRYYTCYYPRGYNDGSSDWNKLPKPVTDVETILSVSRESGRVESIKDFMESAKGELKKNAFVFLAGDLNEPSHLDWGKNTKDLYDHRGCIVNWDVSIALYNNGFKDAYREIYPDAADYPGFTFPADNKDADISMLTWAPEADERERIDFIYYYPSESLTITHADIFGPKGSIVRSERKKEESKDSFILPLNGNWPSDHKGVFVKFTFHTLL